MEKKFKEFVTEAKVTSHEGVTLGKATDHPLYTIHTRGSYLKGTQDKVAPAKTHQVFLHGKHIGDIHQSMHQPYKKITGSRMVKPMAERKVWRTHHNVKLANEHGLPHYRSSHFHSKEEAANHLARHFRRSRQERQGLTNEEIQRVRTANQRIGWRSS